MITGLFSALPPGRRADPDLAAWRYRPIGDANRFFSLHYLLPLCRGGIILHIWALHIPGSGNPTGRCEGRQDTIPFHPYYTAKDGFGAGIA